jgi:hypothetical protein
VSQPDYAASMIAAEEQAERETLTIPDFLRKKAITPANAADVLQQMANTYRERNAVYGDNFRMVGPMMRILFPNGVPASVVHSDQFHLFELILVKLSRFAISNLQHKDSIHDAAVYAAMIEGIINEHDSRNGR